MGWRASSRLTATPAATAGTADLESTVTKREVADARARCGLKDTVIYPDRPFQVYAQHGADPTLFFEKAQESVPRDSGTGDVANTNHARLPALSH